MQRSVSLIHGLYVIPAIALMTIVISSYMMVFALLSWIPGLKPFCKRVIEFGPVRWSLGLRILLPGLTYRYHGLENLPSMGHGAVVVANHTSLIDIPMLCCLKRPFAFVAKKSLWKIPFFGRALVLMGCIPVDRSDAESRRWTFNRSVDRIRQGGWIVFFPEGTRTRDGNLLPFKLGAFRLAHETNADILPVTIVGARDYMQPGKVLPSPGHIDIHIHPIIRNTSDVKVEELQERTVTAISSPL